MMNPCPVDVCAVAVHCPHDHADCPLVEIVQSEIEHAAHPTLDNEIQRSLARHEAARVLRDNYGRKVPVCPKCGDSGWVPAYMAIDGALTPCGCAAGEQC